MKVVFKKYLCFFIIFLIFVSSPIFAKNKYTFAESDKTEIEIELENNVENQLDKLDLSEIDQILSDISSSETLFENDTFTNKVKKLVKGEIDVNSNSFLLYIGNIFIEDVLNFLPSVCLIIAIAVLYSMLFNVKTNNNLNNIIHFVCYGSIVVIVIAGITNIIGITSSTIIGLKTQMNAVFPVLLTTLTALGGTSSVGIYQPAMATLATSVVEIFSNVLLPIFTFKIIFNIISNLTSNIKFNKFSEFFGSCFKWIIGIILTVFSAFISIKGIMAGSVDGISIKTAKYTIKGGVPIIGGFLADGMGLIMVSSSLIKNAVGVGGLLLMFCTIIMPVVKIIGFAFLMKLSSAILEPISDNRITSFINDISKSISMIVSLILGVAFMYFIVVGLVMCSANVV